MIMSSWTSNCIRIENNVGNYDGMGTLRGCGSNDRTKLISVWVRLRCFILSTQVGFKTARGSFSFTSIEDSRVWRRKDDDAWSWTCNAFAFRMGLNAALYLTCSHSRELPWLSCQKHLRLILIVTTKILENSSATLLP